MVLAESEVTQLRLQQGIRLVPLFGRDNGGWQAVSVVSFRNPRHLGRVVAELVADQPIAFHGWGVSGVGKRVDVYAEGHAFWFYKEGRPLGSKIPLLEPPKYAVRHVDWEKVHPDFSYLEDPRHLRDLWGAAVPFHIIFPHNRDEKTLSDVVVTPAYEPDVAPKTPVPTICVFWIEDPALVSIMKEVKRVAPEAQVGVSSLNNNKESPPYNTVELIDHLGRNRIGHYKIVVEDPMLEPLDIASSHSQFVIPLKDQNPVWFVRRRGSLSPAAFARLTGFDIDKDSAASARVASRRAGPSENLDPKVFQAACLINSWKRRPI